MNKNKNPLNIKGADRWKGKLGNDSRGHVIFSDPAFGIRAAARTIQSKWINGKRTIRAICRDWAPASDTIGSIPGNAPNDPDAYADFVAQRSGIPPNFPLPEPTTCPNTMLKILEAMALYDMGEECPMAYLYRGVGYWLEDFG